MIDQPAEGLVPLARALRREELAVDDYLDRLAGRFTDREGEIRAFMPEEGRFERLRSEARALRRRYPRPADRPPLYGVPVGVKDIFRADGLPTGAGSRLPAEEFVGAEAVCVTDLKRLGALVLGKTVSTEFAYFPPGPTRNPRNPGHTPGGSSSGSAAAVAAGLCPLALGTQTIGSISRPAAFCGVVGFKPSYDRIPRAGAVPLSPSLDHVGPFTADAAGARLAGGLLCRGFEEGKSEHRRPVLGVPEGPYLERADPAAGEHFRDVCRRLEEAGYTVKAVAALADCGEIAARHMRIVAAQAARVHERWFDRYRELYHPKTVELVERGRSIGKEALAQALTGCGRLRLELTDSMQEHGLDLWISPAAPGPAPAGLDDTGDPVMNLPWTHAGLPTLCLPSGSDRAGLPLGLQLAARWYWDEALLDWGVEIEGDLE